MTYANPAALVSTEWVADHLHDPNVRLLEVDVDTTAYDRGHLEGACGINWTTQLGDRIRRRTAVGLIGTAWAVATYLAVPSLAVEGVGPIEALKRSAGLIRKTWGEGFVGNIGIGWIGTSFYFIALDLALRKPWGPLTLSRTEAEVIEAGGKLIKPRRFWVKLAIKGNAAARALDVFVPLGKGQRALITVPPRVDATSTLVTIAPLRRSSKRPSSPVPSMASGASVETVSVFHFFSSCVRYAEK